MIPMEPITALVGLVTGIIKQNSDQKNRLLELAIKGNKMELDDRLSARKMSVNNKGIQWTKRILALLMVSTYCALHLGISIPELLHLSSQVTVGYTEIVPKFLFFGEKEAFKWHTIPGSAITPAFSHAVMLIVGYYFGSGGTRK